MNSTIICRYLDSPCHDLQNILKKSKEGEINELEINISEFYEKNELEKAAIILSVVPQIYVKILRIKRMNHVDFFQNVQCEKLIIPGLIFYGQNIYYLKAFKPREILITSLDLHLLVKSKPATNDYRNIVLLNTFKVKISCELKLNYRKLTKSTRFKPKILSCLKNYILESGSFDFQTDSNVYKKDANLPYFFKSLASSFLTGNKIKIILNRGDFYVLKKHARIFFENYENIELELIKLMLLSKQMYFFQKLVRFNNLGILYFDNYRKPAKNNFALSEYLRRNSFKTFEDGLRSLNAKYHRPRKHHLDFLRCAFL